MPTNAYVVGSLAGYGSRSMLRDGYLTAYLSKKAATVQESDLSKALAKRNVTTGTVREAVHGPAAATKAGKLEDVAAAPPAKITPPPPAKAAIVPNPNQALPKRNWFDALMGPTPFLRGYNRAEVQAASNAYRARQQRLKNMQTFAGEKKSEAKTRAGLEAVK